MTTPDPVARALALKAAYDADALDETEHREFMELLHQDPDVRRALGADVVLDRLLHVQATAPSVDDVIRGVHLRRQAEASASRFLRRVRPRTRLVRRRAWRWPAGIGAAAALLAVVLLARTTTTDAMRVESAQAASRGGRLLVPGMVIVAGDRLELGAGGTLVLRHGDGSRLELFAHTTLEVQSLQPAKTLLLTRGRIMADVEPQPTGQPLRIVTPHAQATVLGTRFTLSVEATSILEVQTGRVRFAERSGAAREIAAGERMEIGAPEPGAAWDEAEVHYRFDAGGGAVVRDRARGGLDLRITDPQTVEWLPGGGLRLGSPNRLTSEQPATALVQACRVSNAFSVLVDIEPELLPPDADARDLPRRIICLPLNADERNFSLGQGLFAGSSGVFDMRVRTTAGTPRGRPSLATAEELAQPRRMVVVFTRDAAGNARFYCDGRPVAVRTVDERDRLSAATASASLPGRLDSWDPALRITLGAEAYRDQFGSRAWTGTFHRVAVFARVLAEDEVVRLSVASAEP